VPGRGELASAPLALAFRPPCTTLHQLRHSTLTHDAEAGASTPMLMAKSGHTSVASLAKYARPSTETLARWQEANDPVRRR
jgi:integrase/recombinase XerC/integrase/recombinase XerD